MKNVSISNMAKEIQKTFEEFGKATNETVTEAIEETAEDLVKELKRTSPRSSGKRRSGKYSRSWKIKDIPIKKAGAVRGRIVYNKEYQLTHLLENGHRTRSGGTVPGKPHIRPAQAKAEKEPISKIKEGIKRQ